VKYAPIIPVLKVPDRSSVWKPFVPPKRSLSIQSSSVSNTNKSTPNTASIVPKKTYGIHNINSGIIRPKNFVPQKTISNSTSNVMLPNAILDLIKAPSENELANIPLIKPSSLVSSGADGKKSIVALDFIGEGGFTPLILWSSAKSSTTSAGSSSTSPHSTSSSVSPASSIGASSGNGSTSPIIATEPPQHVIQVEALLCKFLRDHQREGVKFLFECINNMRLFKGHGAILADDMGLGKTLQSITLLYTVLRQGFTTKEPIVKRALVVCPTSLVNNWAKEISKWVGKRVKPLAMAEVSREQAIMDIATFLSEKNKYYDPENPLTQNTGGFNISTATPVLIISYETFRLHAKMFHECPHSCDLLICDEAHRLKNDETLTNKALNDLPCRRRILLTGTPMQNDLTEFYAMLDFTNPGVLGDVQQFNKRFAAPILIGREPSATLNQKKRGEDASNELSSIVNQFVMRRTNSLLSQHLPPKLLQVVCVKLTDLQRNLYTHFLESSDMTKLMNGKSTGVLASITALRKLVNHPKLLYDALRQQQAAGTVSKDSAAGFKGCEKFFPPNFQRERSALSALSGKFLLVERMLTALRKAPEKDRVVIVSCYTQTLDLFSILCKEKEWPFIRLDGSSAPGKRQAMVDEFNDPYKDQFVFLLSSRAGGCGLNLIGGNRLFLFDPDWNPATDLQAAARVWRDGQRKKVYVYRLLATGTLEEKVFQRQLSKKGLQTIVVDEGDEINALASDDLRDLFTLCSEGTPSDTHDSLRCMRCRKPELDLGDSDEEMEAGKLELGNAAAKAAELAKVKAAEQRAQAEAAAAAAAATEAAAIAEQKAVADAAPAVLSTVAAFTTPSASVSPRSNPAGNAASIGNDRAVVVDAGLKPQSPTSNPGPISARPWEEIGITEEEFRIISGEAKPKKKKAKKSEQVISLDVDTPDVISVGSASDASDGEKKRKKKPKKASSEPAKGSKKASRAEAELLKAEEALAVSIMKASLQEQLPAVPPGTSRRQLKWPGEDELKHWSHHMGVEDIADPVLKSAGSDLVTFTFGLEVKGKDPSEFKHLPAATRQLVKKPPANAPKLVLSLQGSTSGGDKDTGFGNAVARIALARLQMSNSVSAAAAQSSSIGASKAPAVRRPVRAAASAALAQIKEVGKELNIDDPGDVHILRGGDKDDNYDYRVERDEE
jgi:superfamily II DNA or RNA helicase